MKYYFVILSYFLLTSTPLISQNINDIVFRTKTHDFGSFSEDSESQTYTFEFINQSKSLIVITHVQTTCGCATAHYTKEPVFPGKKGNINITYNPQGRPGKFNRSILVSFAGMEDKVKMNITGIVIPGMKRKHKRFPYFIDDLQLKTTGLRFSPMRSKEEERSIQVINSGKVPLRIAVQSTDVALSSISVPYILSPDSIGEIKIIRKADATSTQMKCIRLNKEKTHPSKAGHVYIEISTEKCK